eukprot:3493333-Pyramimonas_sp.AAC.1
MPTDPTARAQTCTDLVMMMLELREPRTCLFPFSEQKGAGDIVDAVLGIYALGSSTGTASVARDLRFRTQFGLTWHISNLDCHNLHRRFTDALRHASVLTRISHHHDVSKQAGCPSTWEECE